MHLHTLGNEIWTSSKDTRLRAKSCNPYLGVNPDWQWVFAISIAFNESWQVLSTSQDLVFNSYPGKTPTEVQRNFAWLKDAGFGPKRTVLTMLTIVLTFHNKFKSLY